MMTNTDHLRFFQALDAMALYFSDEMTKPRQHMYWDVFLKKVTIDEWEYACREAIERETFRKVPLAPALMAYVKELRIRQADDARRREQQRQLDAEQQALATGPQITEAERKAQTSALLAQLNEAMTFPAPRREERDPAYRQPLDAAEFADRKARLLRQAQQIMEDGHGHETA